MTLCKGISQFDFLALPKGTLEFDSGFSKIMWMVVGFGINIFQGHLERKN